MELRDRLQGIFPPVITNFDSAGEIAPIPFRENLRRWMETPIDGKYRILSRLGVGGIEVVVCGRQPIIGATERLLPIEPDLARLFGEQVLFAEAEAQVQTAGWVLWTNTEDDFCDRRLCK